MKMDIVNLISSFVGSQNLFKIKVQNCLVNIAETARSWKSSNNNKRKEKHMAEGLELAVKMIAWSINDPYFINIF